MKKRQIFKIISILALSIMFIIGCSFVLIFSGALLSDKKTIETNIEMGKAVDIIVPTDSLTNMSNVMPGEVLSFKNVVISANDSSLCYLRAKISLQYKDSSDNIISADWLNLDSNTSISGWFYDADTQWWYYGTEKSLENLSIVSDEQSAQLQISEQSIDSSYTDSTMIPLSRAELFITFEAIQIANMQTDTIFITESWIS